MLRFLFYFTCPQEPATHLMMIENVQVGTINKMTIGEVREKPQNIFVVKKSYIVYCSTPRTHEQMLS